MFESVSVGRPGQSIVNSLGKLAEYMLYYEHVHLIVDHQGFQSLLRTCGPDTLLGLISDGHLDVVYQENRLAVATQTVSGREQHAFVAFEAPRCAAQRFVPSALEELLGEPGKACRLARRLLDRLTVRRYDLSQAREVLMSLDDANYTSRGAALLLANLTPGYKPLTVVEFDVRFDGVLVWTGWTGEKG